MVGLAVLSVWGGLTVLTCAIVLMRLLASMTGLVQAFIEGQRMLLLDEPFNALDADSVVRVKQLYETSSPTAAPSCSPRTTPPTSRSWPPGTAASRATGWSPFGDSEPFERQPEAMLRGPER